MASDHDEFQQARELRRIALTGLGLAVGGLAVIMGFAFWLAQAAH